VGGDIGSVHQILLFCATMYCLIGVMWLLYLKFGGVRSPEVKMTLLCISWASMSIGMHVLNKTLVVALDTPSLVAAAQMTITVGATLCMSGRELLATDRQQLTQWLIVPVFFAGMLCSSAYTYMYISLSMLTIVRNLSPLISMPIERLVMPADKIPRFDWTSMLAMVVMLIGALVYGGGVKDIEFVGVLLACLNMAIAVTDRVIQRRLLTTECKDLSSGVCTLVTNFWGIIPTMCLAGATGELQHMATGSTWKDADTRLLLLISGMVGLLIGYLGFECQRMISATSFFVLQNASKVAVVSAGIIFFNDPLKPETMLGVSLSLVGSFMYSHAQRNLPKEDKEREPLVAAKDKV